MFSDLLPYISARIIYVSDLLSSIYTHLETWTTFFLAVVVNENIPGDMLFLRKGGETSIVLAILIL